MAFVYVKRGNEPTKKTMLKELTDPVRQDVGRDKKNVFGQVTRREMNERTAREKERKVALTSLG